VCSSTGRARTQRSHIRSAHLLRPLNTLLAAQRAVVAARKSTDCWRIGLPLGDLILWRVFGALDAHPFRLGRCLPPLATY
jgi:hypothetical protein